jgi:hypothetical protein
VANEVPFSVEYALPRMEVLTLTPGAVKSGLIRLLPSTVTGPLLLKFAMTPVLASLAPS